MITITRDFSFSVQTSTGFQETIDQLRSALRGEGFEIMCEIPFHREFNWDHGLPWKKYTVLVIWSPCHAFQALLSDRDGGLLVPFNLVVAADDLGTLVAVGNYAHFAQHSAVGLQVLVRGLNRQLRMILAQLPSRGVASTASQHEAGVARRR